MVTRAGQPNRAIHWLKKLRYCLCIHVWDWNSFWPPRVPICHWQTIIVSLRRRKRIYKVEMFIIETLWLVYEFFYMGFCMTNYLRLLTYDGMLNSLDTIFLRRRPNENELILRYWGYWDEINYVKLLSQEMVDGSRVEPYPLIYHNKYVCHNKVKWPFKL